MLTISIEAKRTFQLPPCRIKNYTSFYAFPQIWKCSFCSFTSSIHFYDISPSINLALFQPFLFWESLIEVLQQMHISIYPIFHRATSHLYVHVIVSACWFDHVMFTWGSRRYWCEIPYFRLFLKFVFHRVNSKNLGEKDLEINHLEMIRKNGMQIIMLFQS